MDVSDGIVGTKASEGVNMAVGVVTSEVAMVEPKDTIGMEVAQQALLDLVAREVGVAVGREETFAGSQ